MKITEKCLLDNYDGITNGLYNISVIDGNTIVWVYREYNSDGHGARVTFKREYADYISLEYDRYGKIEIDNSIKNHPALEKMLFEIEKVIGKFV